MYFVTIILLIFAAGSQCMNNDCHMQKDPCDDLQFSPELPRTKEELDKSCREVIQYGNCLIKHWQECPPERFDERDIMLFKKFMLYIETTCDPENDIYKVVVDNLECMISAMDDIKLSCKELQISKARKNVLGSHMERIGAFNESNIDYQIIRCLEGFWNSACSAITVGEKCGEKSKFAALDILLNTDYELVHYCTDSEIALIEGFMEAYEEANKEIETEGEGRNLEDHLFSNNRW